MSAGLKGDLSGLRKLERSIRELPIVLGQRVAAACAGKLTSLARSTFAAGENAFGDSWAPGAQGQRVTLRKSGGIAGGVFYVAIGRRLRARLGPRYAKYQVGKRPIFPRGGALPGAYVAAIRAAAADAIREQITGGA